MCTWAPTSFVSLAVATTSSMRLPPLLDASMTRRLVLPLPLALLPALTPQPAVAQSKTREGMALFAGNKVEEAIAVYDSMVRDAAQALEPGQRAQLRPCCTAS